MRIKEPMPQGAAGLSAPRKKESASADSTPQSPGEANGLECPLTPKEMAGAMKVSTSWLAKARMRGDGPPYTKVGRMVRYFPSQTKPWLKLHQRSSTSE
jgi:hypothetical protein